jgi:hypothetical protein
LGRSLNAILVPPNHMPPVRQIRSSSPGSTPLKTMCETFFQGNGKRESGTVAILLTPP